MLGQIRQAGPVIHQGCVGQAAEGDIGERIADFGAEGGQLSAMAFDRRLGDRAAVRVGSWFGVEVTEYGPATGRQRLGAKTKSVLHQLGGVEKDKGASAR